MDRKLYDTPEKVLEFGLRRVITEQIKMLDEADARERKMIQVLHTLGLENAKKDQRLDNQAILLSRKPGPRIGTPSPIKQSEIDIRIEMKRLRSQLSFHKGKSAGRKRYIVAMREAGFGRGPMTRREHPRGDRLCSRCGEYREHYKNCAYCIECWKHYKPLKMAQVKYEKNRVRTNRNGVRVRMPRTSGLTLQSESGSGLRLVTEPLQETTNDETV